MKLFVWDFHGVLEKGNDAAVLKITNLALQHHGYSRRMSEDENEFLSGRRWHEYFAFLLPEAKEEEHLNLQSTCHEIDKNQPEIISENICLNDHADLVLSNIHNSQHHQILISNTQPQNLEKFVNMVNIQQYFPSTHRFGVNTHQQKKLTKQDYLNQFLQNKDPFEAIISIGDSPGDMALIDQEMTANGIGYLYVHPGKQHRAAKCHHKINDLRLVLQEISHEMAYQGI